ncbi:peptidoglycan-associated lipoprotein Pal [Marinobacterium jannaschii]|uniref:peptidoglycan-associated lipoprotein Pal n=1 Tax=Marinobacterium jannaschii TaxID=64970 RepID=UPI000485ACE4|nr:peptidoglycan-associated lipoprotein Pal [Marinobacterium jannaschii]
MRASNVTKAVALALSMAWVAGCSTSGSKTDAGAEGAVDTASTQGATDTGVSRGADDAAAAAAAAAERAAQQAAQDLQNVANLQTVFYFDFDKSSVQAQGLADLERHAQFLAANPAVGVRLEGHADERGTREYNIALGERRAKAVARVMMVNGVSASQIETISYGEEKPAVLGHNDQSWAENRRVELKYSR